jgi:hypothetical protein
LAATTPLYVNQETTYSNTFPGWQAAILEAIKAPITAANIDFLTAWHNAEGSNAKFNPLNTTQGEPGSSSINSSGVQSYSSAASGTAATAATLQNGYYPDIAAALASGNPAAYLQAHGGNVASQIGKWGTNAGTVLRGYAQDIYAYSGVKNFPVIPFPVGGSLTADEAAAAGAAGGAEAGAATGAGAAVGAGTAAKIAAGVGTAAVLAEFYNKLTSISAIRWIEMISGGALVLGSLFLLAKQVGLQNVTPVLSAIPGGDTIDIAAAQANTAAYSEGFRAGESYSGGDLSTPRRRSERRSRTLTGDTTPAPRAQSYDPDLAEVPF